MKIQSKNKFSEEGIFLTISCISFSAFTASLFASSIFLKTPCFLCIFQKYIYLSIAILALIGMKISSKRTPTYFLLILGFLGICTAAYHALIQYELIVDSCNIFQVTNLDSYITQLLDRKSSSCSEILWSFLGLPISIWSFAGFMLCEYGSFKILSSLKKQVRNRTQIMA